MKTGYFAARADQRGLAYQSLGYCTHLNFDRIYGLDLTADDLSPYECDWRPYESLPSDLYVNRHSQLDEQDVRHFLRGLDVVLGAETFYRDEFVTWAKEEGVKTVLAVNAEFVPYWSPRGGSDIPKPDVMIAPTPWRLDEMPGAIHLPFPVDRLQHPFHPRTTANRFVHVAGHRAAGDRAGTRIVMGAIPRFSGALTIKSQSPLGLSSPRTKGRVSESNVASPQELYADADVIIHLRRYGGNSLVIQEALSSGCPVITLNRSPENEWSGVYPIPSRERQSMRTKAGVIRVHDGSSQHLVKVMNELVNNPAKVEQLSYAANEHSRQISWDVLLPVYERFLQGVVDGASSDDLRGIADPFRAVPHPDSPVAP